MKFVAYSLAAMLLVSTIRAGQAADDLLAAQRDVPAVVANESSPQHREGSDQADAPTAKKPVLRQHRRIYRTGYLVRAAKARANEAEGAATVCTAEDLAPLMNYLRANVAPATWGQTLSGNATIAPYPKESALVISQTTDVHKEIAKELTRLREAYQVIDQFEQIANSADMPTK